MAVEVRQNENPDSSVDVIVHYEIPWWDTDASVFCQLTESEIGGDWVQGKDGTCQLVKKEGTYFLYLKYHEKIQMVGKKELESEKLLAIDLSEKQLFLAVGGQKQLEVTFSSFGEVEKELTWRSSNEEVATVENGNIIGKAEGKASITVTTVNGRESTAEVLVTSLLNVMPSKFQFRKPYLTCNQFTREEAELLDTILEARIREAGYQTRGGVVAAVRFLTLEFPYRISYFYENGRLENHYNKRKIDGEGRYYHKGLYLSTEKYTHISPSWDGPKMWGCPLTNRDDTGPYVLYAPYPNGLDCSGFISWALLNGGFDVGDIGAGIDPNYPDFSDLGEQVPLTHSLLNSGRVKVGDLIGLYGHIAMIIGYDEDYYYIAESLVELKGVSITTYKKASLPGIYSYVMLMDSVYQEDGKVTSFWY